MDHGFRLEEIDPLSGRAANVGLARQLMRAALVSHGDGRERGVRSVLLENDRVSVEVVVDRALDIANARVDGIPIAWRPPTGIAGPWFVENTGFGPQRTFFGGLLMTCGLDHIGAPVERSAERFGYALRTVDRLPMHGRINGIPATLRAYGVEERHGRLAAFVSGEVEQVSLFGEQLILRRTIELSYGSTEVRVIDEVANEGYASSPLAVLYHVNAGWPVVAPGAIVTVSGQRRRGEGDGSVVAAPVAGTRERSWLYAVEADERGMATASLSNPDVGRSRSAGFRITWGADTMPSVAHWETMNIAGHYAIGLEPQTTLPEGPPQERRFPAIEPGERVQLGVRVELFTDAIGRS